MKKLLMGFLCLSLVHLSGQQEMDSAVVDKSQVKKEVLEGLRKGIVIPLDKYGKSFARLAFLGQFGATYNDKPGLNGTDPAGTVFGNLEEKKFEANITRARILAMASILDKGFIFAQIGTSKLDNDNINTLGNEPQSQMSLLTFYGELKFHDAFIFGTGLHNFRGGSRLANSGLADFITVSGPSLAFTPANTLTDQIGYHLGAFIRGKVGRFQYQASVDEASRNNSARLSYFAADDFINSTNPGLPQGIRDQFNPFVPGANKAPVYRGAELLGGAEAGVTYSTYVNFQLMDKEDFPWAFRNGAYFGTKKVLNIGGGAFYHPNGLVSADSGGNLKGEDALVWAADVFYDAPITKNKDAITFLGTFQKMDYGENFDMMGDTSGLVDFVSGEAFYSHLAFFHRKTRLQPFVYYQQINVDKDGSELQAFGAGVNFLLLGPNARFSAEYRNVNDRVGDVNEQLLLQLILFM